VHAADIYLYVAAVRQQMIMIFRIAITERSANDPAFAAPTREDYLIMHVNTELLRGEIIAPAISSIVFQLGNRARGRSVEI